MIIKVQINLIDKYLQFAKISGEEKVAVMTLNTSLAQLDCHMRILLMTKNFLVMFRIRSCFMVAFFFWNNSTCPAPNQTKRYHHPHNLAISEIISVETIINMKICVTCQGNIEFFKPLLIFINSHIWHIGNSLCVAYGEIFKSTRPAYDNRRI